MKLEAELLGLKYVEADFTTTAEAGWVAAFAFPHEGGWHWLIRKEQDGWFYAVTKLHRWSLPATHPDNEGVYGPIATLEAAVTTANLMLDTLVVLTGN